MQWKHYLNHIMKLMYFLIRVLEKHKYKYSVVLQLDLNKIPKHEETRIVKSFRDFKKHLQETQQELLKKTEFVYLNRTPKDNQLSYQVYIRDDEKYSDRLRQHQETNMDVIKSLSVYNEFGQSHSYVYRLDEQIEVNKDSLDRLFNQVINGLATEYFKSQKNIRIKFKQFNNQLHLNRQKQFLKVISRSYKKYMIHLSNCNNTQIYYL